MRARRCNFAKSAAIFKKHDEARFSMSVTSGLSVRGGVENINARGWSLGSKSVGKIGWSASRRRSERCLSYDR